MRGVDVILLPVGSFAESGTNISTTVMTVWAPKE